MSGTTPRESNHETVLIKQPYCGPDDFRLKWLDTTFLQYLEEWEAAVQSREDVTAAQKKSMLLSTETLTGLKLTSKTIVF